MEARLHALSTQAMNSVDFVLSVMSVPQKLSESQACLVKLVRFENKQSRMWGGGVLD